MTKDEALKMATELHKLREDLWFMSGLVLISFEHYAMGAFFIFVSSLGCFARNSHD